MLEASNRLRDRQSIQQVYRRGRQIRGRYFIVRYLKNPQHEGLRVAVVISTKIAKLATLRNRLRRRIRAVVAQSLRQLPAGYDLIINVTDPKLGLLEAAGLAQELQTALSKLEPRES